MDTTLRSFETLGRLRHHIDQTTADYIRSTPLATYDVQDQSLSFDIRDLLLMGALTQSDVLLTGKTGEGKTKLANGLMLALFGPEGFYSKTTLPNMQPSEFMDIDFPAIVEGRKTLKEALSGVAALERPGIVLNEVNRAPALIQSLMIAFLDRHLEVQGVSVAMGRPCAFGRYQFRILTINEGEHYQVHDMDPAIRDRMILEIPVDAFPRTKNDMLQLLQTDATDPARAYGPSDTIHGFDADHFEDVVDLLQTVRRVPVSPEALYFLAYLAGLSYCVRSPRGNKELVELSHDLCDGCHHAAAFHGICGNIFAPSARVLLRLMRVAKAFAFFRAWRTKQETELVVLNEDIIAAAPFVLYSKLALNPLWLRTAADRHNRFFGDKWTAVQSILRWIYEERFARLIDPAKDVGDILFRYGRGMPLRPEDYEKLYQYVMEKDPWAFDPALLRTLWRANRNHETA